jgi:enoyl-CoA hydratase
MSTGPLVTWSVEDGVGSVRLSDPAHRNALSAELSDALALAVASVLSDDAGAIVLTADPPVFCAGGSLDGLLTRDVPLAETYRGFEALARAPVPTIAAVGSPAIGAGVNLPLACDIIVVSEGARFDPRFLDVGIHPGGGHLWRLQHRIGSQGAAALVLCGDVLDGGDAVVAGLAWRCVAPADLEATAHRWARRAAGRSRPLVARTKATLRASQSILDGDEATALELEAQQWSMEQPGFDEGIQAMQESLRDRRKTDRGDG